LVLAYLSHITDVLAAPCERAWQLGVVVCEEGVARGSIVPVPKLHDLKFDEHLMNPRPTSMTALPTLPSDTPIPPTHPLRHLCKCFRPSHTPLASPLAATLPHTNSTTFTSLATYPRPLKTCSHLLCPATSPHCCTLLCCPLSHACHPQHRVKAPGSCTALVAVLRGNGVLDVTVVGDCGLRLVRDGEVVLATEVREGGSGGGGGGEWGDACKVCVCAGV